MLKKMLALSLLVGIGLPLSTFAGDSLVKFKGGIGVLPVSNISGTATNPPTNSIFPEVTRNIVRGVNPPGQIWVIADLRADVKADGLGSIKVRGKGLLLGGGNAIGGTNNARVFATLICGPLPNGPFTFHSTESTLGVLLEPNGDFRIEDQLNPVPFDCANPVLLIRNLAGAWFAAGIVNLKNDD
jgi:hypothetical protein